MAIQVERSKEQVRFRPRRLGHVNVSFQNFDEAVHFYTKVAGIEKIYGKAGIQSAFFSNGNTHHDMGTSGIGAHSPGEGAAGAPTDPRRRRVPRLNHLAYEMENETLLVDGWRRSQVMGIPFYGKDHIVSHGLYTKDFEGNGVEIYADFHKEWREILNLENHASPTSDWIPGETPPIHEPRYHADPEIRRVKGAIFHPRRVAHAALVAGDLENEVAYYTDIVGLDVLFYGPHRSYVILGGTLGGHDLTIFQATEGQLLGLHHIAFELDDEQELDAAEKRVKEAAIQAVLQIEHSTKRAIFLKDPDGLLVEFFVGRSASLDQLKELEPGMALCLA